MQMGRAFSLWVAPVVGVALVACNGTVRVGNTGFSGNTDPQNTDTAMPTGGETELPGTTDGGSTSTSGGQDTDGGSSLSGGTDDGPKLDIADIPEPPSAEFPQTCDEAEAAETSVGCVFHPIYLPRVSNGLVGFAAANVSSETAHVELFTYDGMVDVVDVEPGAVHIFERDTSLRVGFLGDEIGRAGYELVSDFPLQVFTFMPFSGTLVTNDASIMFPSSTLGTRYRIANFEVENAVGSDQHVTVVATEDNTEVTFSLVNAGAVTTGSDMVPALDYDAGNDSLTVTLNRFEHVAITAPEWIEDQGVNPLYGSLVESSAPVAVYSGVGGLVLNAGANDVVHTAVPPTSVFGTQYAAAKFIPVGNAPDIWRFVGNEDGTVVELQGGGIDQTIELEAGEVYDLWTSASFWAEGNEPFGLLHLMTGAVANPPLIPHDCDEAISGPGDPAMGWVFAQENWLNRYLMPVGQASDEAGADQWCHNHLTVVAPLEEWEAIEVDGLPLPDPLPIGNDDFGYAYVPAPPGTHELVAPEGVGVQVDVYGFHHNGSYFYPGGMGLRNINPAG